MELSRRTLLAAGAGAGAGLALPAAGRAIVRSGAGSVGYVTPGQFGAIPGDPGAASENVAAFNRMTGRAIASGLEILIPKGVWYLRAIGGPESGWEIRPSSTRPCVIRGEGDQSVLRRAPAAQASKFSTMVRLRVATGGEKFELRGIAIDGNESAFPFDVNDPWAYQQSHCIELIPVSPALTAAAMIIEDLWFAGVVADGVKVGAQCDSFEARRVFASGRVRRHRSDIQFSTLPKSALVSDCELDAFEAEPSRMVPGARMQLKNVTARAAFDLSGPEDDPGGRLRVLAENCRGGMQRAPGAPVTSTNFYRLQGIFSNCAFATSPARKPARANVVRASALRFENSQFRIGGSIADPADASPLFARFEQPADRLEFAACRFAADPGVQRGAYVGMRGRSASGLLALQDCETDGALEFIVHAAGLGRVQLSGGALRSKRALVTAAPAARNADFEFDRTQSWRSPQRVLHEGR